MATTHELTAFCGLPVVTPDAIPKDTVAAVLGAAYSMGSPHDGAENAPFFLRTVSKAYTWSAAAPAVFDLRHGITLDRVVDLGDLDFGTMTLAEAVSATESAVAALPPGVMPAVIGGDHTVTLPIVSALADRRPRPFSVVQFDHHLDLQIWDGAPANLERAREPIFHTNVMSHVSDRLGAGRLIQVGVSPYATVEAEAAAAVPGFLALVGTQICLSSPAIEDAHLFRAAVGRGADVYLTIDVDVLDRTEMPATGYPAEVGLSTGRLLRLIDLVLADNRLVGFDVVEFAAARSDRQRPTLLAAQRAALVFMHLLCWARRQTAEEAGR